MADLKLDIVITPTYNTYNLAVVDASTYPALYTVASPTLRIDVPGFGTGYNGVFNVNETNIFNSTTLDITTAGNECPIPDGIYYFLYTNNPAFVDGYSVEKSFMRVDKLQEKYDEAFMKLDMMECDGAIKMQAKVDLMSIYIFIQGAIAAANNCAIVSAEKLYAQASSMLDNMINNDCGCTGNNYNVNFYYH